MQCDNDCSGLGSNYLLAAVGCVCLMQLRELVPSAGAVKGPDGADMKRPKHVVLSDTIALLKALKDKVGSIHLLMIANLKQQLLSSVSSSSKDQYCILLLSVCLVCCLGSCHFMLRTTSRVGAAALYRGAAI
jgi:hypothetical protein